MTARASQTDEYLVVKYINAGASRELNLLTDSSMVMDFICDLTAINLN